MRLGFKLSQDDFIKNQQVDRGVHAGLCLSMCIEHVNNSMPNNFIFYQGVQFFFQAAYIVLCNRIGGIKRCCNI